MGFGLNLYMLTLLTKTVFSLLFTMKFGHIPWEKGEKILTNFISGGLFHYFSVFSIKLVNFSLKIWTPKILIIHLIPEVC